jgi:hypothetical protein
VYDSAPKGDALAFEVGHKAIEILDSELLDQQVQRDSPISSSLRPK